MEGIRQLAIRAQADRERLDIQPMKVYDEAVWASIARQGTGHEG
jgi:hypothetical protein